jgi:hypothetical protein
MVVITLYYDTRSTYFNIKNTENIFVAQVSVPATPSLKKSRFVAQVPVPPPYFT